ncbi:hypothetical protein FB451DRAFT_1450340 [Mycena latifolia]|nr:hypothetical protein FB451DRAFT_1450340 [Mycena latifolia]
MQLLLSIVVVGLALIPTTHALVGLTWSMTNVPSDGLTDITFPLTLDSIDHFEGYYLAQEFQFVGSDIGYTGIQPRPDKDGKPVLHGVFSSFINGTTTTDPNCFEGADGGAGVSCLVEWTGVYGGTYEFEVMSPGGRVWVGAAVDTVTGERIHIGEYTLPDGTGGIMDSMTGFVEWYPWNVEIPANHCAMLPYQKTTFGTPRTSNAGSVGNVSLAYEYGDCVGDVAFKTTLVTSGVDVEWAISRGPKFGKLWITKLKRGYISKLHGVQGLISVIFAPPLPV